MDVLAVLEQIENIVRGASFEEWRRDFVHKNVDLFDYADENKLVYTEIYQEYERQLEARIAEGIRVDMSEFMTALPGYLEGAGKHNDRAGKAITLLLEASDFNQFRDMMMFTKKDLEMRRETKLSDDYSIVANAKVTGNELASLDVGSMMEKCANLSTAASSEEGWINLLTNNWMCIDKKPVEVEKRKNKNEIYLKGVWTMELSVAQCCDMMFSMDFARRSQWDTRASNLIFHFNGCQDDDEYIAQATVDMGYLMNLVMFGGKPLDLITKNIRQWDTPVAGAVTYAMIPWSLASNTVDNNHKILTIKTGTISPHPTDANKCVMTTLETNTMGGIPNWAMNFMMSSFAPSMMKGLEQKYLAYQKKTNDFRDMTKFRSRRAEAEAKCFDFGGQDDWKHSAKDEK